eukprot:6236045-Prymnesium_polylepis.2
MQAGRLLGEGVGRAVMAVRLTLVVGELDPAARSGDERDDDTRNDGDRLRLGEDAQQRRECKRGGRADRADRFLHESGLARQPTVQMGVLGRLIVKQAKLLKLANVNGRRRCHRLNWRNLLGLLTQSLERDVQVALRQRPWQHRCAFDDLQELFAVLVNVCAKFVASHLVLTCLLALFGHNFVPEIMHSAKDRTPKVVESDAK